MTPNTGPLSQRFMIRGLPDHLPPGNYVVKTYEQRIDGNVLVIESDFVGPAPAPDESLGFLVRYQRGGLADASEIKVGTKVRLMWNGYPQVPHYLDGAVVTVTKTPYRPRGQASTKLYLQVTRQHDGTDWKTRSVRLDQVREIVE